MIQPSLNIIILGGTGNLAQKSLYPSLYELFKAGKLDEDTSILALGRGKLSQSQFCDMVRASIDESSDIDDFLSLVQYIQADYGSSKFFHTLGYRFPARLSLVYFALPPKAFTQVVTSMGEGCGDKQLYALLFEKPFGQSGKDAKNLMQRIKKYFSPDQIYLLDHYLGKPAVRELITLRLTNKKVKKCLKPEHIKSILIEAREDIGIQDRSEYYEHMGALKDMVQSHLLQLLSIITMEYPENNTTHALHSAKTNLLEKLSFKEHQGCVTIGQYKGYHHEHGVAPDSKTETYIETLSFIDSPNWAHVPITLRTGKMLDKKQTSITINLKKYSGNENLASTLIFEIQPNPGLTLVGQSTTETNNLVNHISTTPFTCSGKTCLSTHAMLLLEAISENKEYFASFEEILLGWRYVEMVEQYIKMHNVPLTVYIPGKLPPKHC